MITLGQVEVQQAGHLSSEWTAVELEIQPGSYHLDVPGGVKLLGRVKDHPRPIRRRSSEARQRDRWVAD